MMSRHFGTVGFRAAILASAVGLWGGASMAADAPAAPTNLRCEYRTTPLGIDSTAPRLSWEVNDSRRGAVQSAYQVLVSTDPADLRAGRGPAWDSGRVASDRSVQVVYAGKPLTSTTRYWWTVRTWDAGGQASPYAEPTWWEMGLLDAKDWTSPWIMAPLPSEDELPNIGAARWIWHPTLTGEKDEALFRTAFDIPAGATIDKALLRITGDDHYVLYLNGKKLGAGAGWNKIIEHDASTALRPGRNVLAVQVRNDGGPGALLLALKIRPDRHDAIEIVSNDTWLTSPAIEGDAWTRPDFDDAGWAKAKDLGKLGDAPWGEIKPQEGARRSVCMRTEIRLKDKPVRARAYATGLGIYVGTVNGERMGPNVFAPGWTKYDKRIQYQTYDVTPLLKAGPNALGVMLGNGWWSGGLGWNQTARFGAGNFRYRLRLDVEYADGTRERFGTSPAWLVHDSPIVRDSFYHGETYDARLEMPGWDRPGFMPSRAWKSAEIIEMEPGPRLVAELSEPIEETQALPTAEVTKPSDGTYVYNFGQNMAGWARLRVRAPAGTTIRIRFAEVLKPDGEIYRDNYRSAQATDVYICKGDGEEVWEPRFTYRGFQYAELTGYPGEPPRDALTAIAVHSAMPMAGHFECSNALLNQLWSNIVWGQRSNLHSVPTDCPQRDERLGWMGDAQTFAPTACWNMKMVDFFEKWMHDILDSQGDDGHVTNVAPVAVVTEPAAPGWGDAVIVIPWTVYRFYGSTRIIEDNYDGMKAWIEYMRRNAPNHLYERAGYGDWIAVVKTPSEPIGAAYYYYSTRLFAQMAEAIGRMDDARTYGKLADDIAAAFNAKYFDPKTNEYGEKTQTANVLPLWFGITPPDRRTAVAAAIADDVRERENHLSTGFLGTAYLLPALSTYGQNATAYAIATQRTYPSWGHMIEKGATTIWELWDSDTKGPEMNSRNHFALGAAGEWMFEYLGGIRIDPKHAGFARFVIGPMPAAGLEWVTCEYPSVHGPIRSAWRQQDGRLTLDVRIPANTSATVRLPAADPFGATVREGDVVVVRNGKAADAVPGVKLVDVERAATIPLPADEARKATHDKDKAAEMVSGPKVLEVGVGAVVLEVGAGTYRFTIEP